MSLRYFHVFFMLSAAACFAFCAYFGRREELPVFLALSAAGLLACAAYLRWFMKRYLAPRAA
jgi:hypothetical protein